MKIQFEAGEGRKFNGVNFLISEDGKIYAEVEVPEGASEDYGYLTMKNAIIEQIGSKGLEFWYDGQEEFLAEDASADCEVYTEIEESEAKNVDGVFLARIVSAKAFKNYSNSNPLTVTTDGRTYAVTGIIDRDNMSLDELNGLLEQIEEVDE